jgi:DNA mismatch endonuclease, patch repair protein
MPLTRREIMQRVRSGDTTPEMTLRRALHAAGLRYRLHVRVDGVRPDIVIKSRRLLVFVDGCFWHCCPRHFRMPRTNLKFWHSKFAGNVARDLRQRRRLRRLGWTVVRVWEHEMRSPESLLRAVDRVMRAYDRI